MLISYVDLHSSPSAKVIKYYRQLKLYYIPKYKCIAHLCFCMGGYPMKRGGIKGYSVRFLYIYKWHHPSLTRVWVREGCECLKWISEVGSIRFGQGPNR